MKESITIDETIDYLNDLIEKDPSIRHLLDIRIHCNEETYNHPTVQVGLHGSIYMVGFIGIINGLFGVHNNGTGAIAADMDNGQIIKFVKTDPKLI